MDDEGAGADERPEAIAIIGMAGRFPKARDVETLWANLCAGIDGVTRFTPAELAELWMRDVRVAPVVVPAWTRMLFEQPAYWIDRADRAGRGATACAAASLPEPARARCVELGWLTAAGPQG